MLLLHFYKMCFRATSFTISKWLEILRCQFVTPETERRCIPHAVTGFLTFPVLQSVKEQTFGEIRKSDISSFHEVPYCGQTNSLMKAIAADI